MAIQILTKHLFDTKEEKWKLIKYLHKNNRLQNVFVSKNNQTIWVHDLKHTYYKVIID